MVEHFVSNEVLIKVWGARGLWRAEIEKPTSYLPVSTQGTWQLPSVLILIAT